MKASELTVKCLENENVDYIFGIPGEENLDLMDALLESEIQFIDCPVNYAENLRLTDELGQLTCPI